MKNTKRQKTKAQAMVEFAIALPILLLLIYGIIEVGRLLFLYSTVVTASRQAARYGATTGENDLGVFRYQDCAGIREAAKNFGILGKFDDTEITIELDEGPGTTRSPYCPAGTSSVNSELEGNDTRLIVTVQDQFVPLVRLVPLSPRTISATSSRTVIIGVPIVINAGEESAPLQDPTSILITSHLPEPSDIDGWVTVVVTVTNDNDTTKIPTGEVSIEGADVNCSILLLNGTGSCQVKFTSEGVKTLIAVYSGDDEHLASDTQEPHNVSKADTTTIITSDSPDPSTKGGDVTVVVTVTGGSTTPTGTVAVSAGGGINCTITLAFGAGSCQLTFNQSKNYTITANYNGDSGHNQSSDTEPHEVLDGTPTPTLSPTATLSPTPTLPPTAGPTPTDTPVPPTPLSSCVVNTVGNLQFSGNTMYLQLNNTTGLSLTIEDILVQWNHDKGHTSGSDKTLILQGVLLNGAVIFPGAVISPGSVSGPSATITPASTVSLPPGASTITFTFSQSYDLNPNNPNDWDNELVQIQLSTPGCEVPISKTKP